ncbi:hypothetical protein GGI07_004916 [Coemansia sp. Benny D115]|nr:hypothetical protein GGI07_004916 [Coemansia sp. Benny D115]
MSINSFFKTESSSTKDDLNTVKWRESGRTWVGTFRRPAPADRFAAFDLDKTLVNVKGPWKYPRGPDDWVFFHASVPKVLQRMHREGYKIVIISNQYGLKPAKGSTGLTQMARDYRLKIQKIAAHLDVPFTILAATEKDYMRKPSPGMWLLAEMDNGGVEVDRSASFFVGDAAGRPDNWRPGAVADFSDSDLAFALNAGVPFYTPEQMFNNKALADEALSLTLPNASAWSLGRFKPKVLDTDREAHASLLAAIKTDAEAAREQGKGLLVLLVGQPASGKSTFATKHLEPLGFERINMDTLKTSKKCHDAVKSGLASGKLLVVDNTNPCVDSRGAYVQLAKGAGARAIAVVFDHETRELAAHNNVYRAQVAQARYLAKDGSAAKDLWSVPVVDSSVPAVAYNMFFKKFSAPDVSEGFERILRHAFVPTFESALDELLWSQYY